MAKITINIPDTDVKRWKDETLVRILCEINGLSVAWLDTLKEDARRRRPSGGQLTDGKTRAVTVSKPAEAGVKIEWDKLAKHLLKSLPATEQAELIERFTVFTTPRKQSVTMR